MTRAMQIVDPQDARALQSAEAALSRIQGFAEAALADQITPAEAVEQILDELALGRVRQAPTRGFSPLRTH